VVLQVVVAICPQGHSLLSAKLLGSRGREGRLGVGCGVGNGGQCVCTCTACCHVGRGAWPTALAVFLHQPAHAL
jgi:hypothetical protein